MFGFFKKNKQDDSELIQIILSADKEDPQALEALNGLYKSGAMSDSRKHSLRKQGYEPLASTGDLEGQMWMGLLAVADDDGETAEHWFLQAAQQGSAQAMLQLSLGYAQFNACSFGENPKTSFQWALKAAELGNADAQCQVAMEYSSGETVPLDHEAAYQWYLKAAAQNYPEAFLALAELHSTDEPWNSHYDSASCRDFLLKAMETREPQVCAKAAPLLALFYAKDVISGESTTIDPADAQSAIYWLCQSFWFGNHSATIHLKTLMDLTGLTVSPEQSQSWKCDYRNMEDDD